MKKKLIVGGILIVFISLIILNFNVVEVNDINPGTEGEEENPNIEWTDFANAKFELKKYGTSQTIVKILKHKK